MMRLLAMLRSKPVTLAPFLEPDSPENLEMNAEERQGEGCRTQQSQLPSPEMLGSSSTAEKQTVLSRPTSDAKAGKSFGKKRRGDLCRLIHLSLKC